MIRFARLFVLIALLLAGPAFAADPIIEQQQPVIDRLVRDVDALAARLDKEKGDDVKLVDIRNLLEEKGKALLNAAVAFRPRRDEINARLDQLGNPPKEGEPAEAEAVTAERAALKAVKAEINTLLGRAEDETLRVNRLLEQISELRRQLFANQLSKRYDLNFALLGEGASEFRAEIAELWRIVGSWWKFVLKFKLRASLLAGFFALAAAAVLVIGGRRVVGEAMRPDPANLEPTYLSRLSVAFASTLLPAAAVATFLGASYFFFDYFNVLRGDIGELMVTSFNVIATVVFIERLARSALSVHLPAWRLIPVENGPARALYWLVLATALTAGADFILSRVNSVLGSPLTLTIAKSFVLTIAVGLMVIAISRLKPFHDEAGRPRRWPNWAQALLLAVGVVTVLSALLGYIGFARFMARQIVVTGALVATMSIGFLTASAVSEEGAFAHTLLGRRAKSRFGAEDTTLDQLGLISGIAINLFMVLAGGPLILLQWGFQWGDIRAFALKILTGVQIGSVTISLLGILTGVAVFVLALFLTRWFQRWLDGQVLARGKVDAGVRNSIRLAVGYAGTAVAGLIGVSAAGIDLSNLALVAGALSLGIGFGLQNIVSNFVSGLILLAERPFKVGDWIVAGAIQGTVKRISVRATEVETFQRQTIILPNSDLINQAVGNWTHKNKLGRIDVPIGVAYGSDAVKVQELMLAAARAEPRAAKSPEPVVFFTGFGASSLDFELRVFLTDITDQIAALNGIRLRILQAFEANGVKIPFPQSEVHYVSEPHAKPVKQARPPAKPAARREKAPVKSRARGRKADPNA